MDILHHVNMGDVDGYPPSREYGDVDGQPPSREYGDVDGYPPSREYGDVDGYPPSREYGGCRWISPYLVNISNVAIGKLITQICVNEKVISFY